MSVKIALVGCGYWGKNLLRTLNSMGVLTATFDSDRSVIESYSKNRIYGDVYFDTDWEKCLGRDDVNGVVIATPPATHFEIAMKCLAAGKSVFIEKPMTLCSLQAKTICELAETKNLIVMVGHIFLYSSEIIKLKEIIYSEEFGNVLYIYTKRLNLGQVQACGVINDLMAHDVSVVNYLLDRSCDSVSAHGDSNIIKGVEDVAFVNMKYGNVTSHLHLSWLDPNKVRETVVVGTKQMVVCDSINKKIDIYNKMVDLSAMEDSMSLDYARHLLSYRYGDVVSPYISVYEPLMAECKEFVACIEEKRRPLADGRLGLEVVKTLAAAKKSLENNGAWEQV